MFTIVGNGIITLNRGDTFTIPLDINIGTGVAPKYYTLKGPQNEDYPEDRDRLFFALLEPNQRWEDAIVKKVYTSDDIAVEYGVPLLHFYSEDTEYLKPGTYYYQVKLLRSRFNDMSENVDKSIDDGFEHVDTVIPRTKFIILE